MNNPGFQNDNRFNLPHAGEAERCLSAGDENQESTPPQTGELWILVEGMLGSVVRLLGASGGIVRVLSPNSQTLQIAGAIGLPIEVCEDESVVDSGCGVCGKAACDRGVHRSDAAICAQRPSRNFSDAGCNHVVASSLESKGNLIGVITLFFADGGQVPANIAQLLRPFAELIGIALETARKNIESRRILLIAERQAMANEIHDSLAHTLYYARMRMNLLLEAVRTKNEQLAVKCAHDVDEALGSGQKTMREIITHFRCQMNPLGLQYALQTLVDEFRDHSGITLSYINSVVSLELPLEHELQIFHIIREALANVETHSAAAHASLTIERNKGHYVFTIADNGAGCSGTPCEGHYGLMIMRERALRIGGEVNIEGSDGNGTRVQLRIPESKDSGNSVLSGVIFNE